MRLHESHNKNGIICNNSQTGNVRTFYPKVLIYNSIVYCDETGLISNWIAQIKRLLAFGGECPPQTELPTDKRTDN